MAADLNLTKEKETISPKIELPRDLIIGSKPILRKKAKFVSKITPSIKSLVKHMEVVMQKVQGIGLAAPQVGELKKVIVFYNEKWEVQHLINPEIINTSKETQLMNEGCLSFPGLRGWVERFAEVTVKGQNLKGETVTIEGRELLSQILQHEIDHLNGILFIDKIVSINDEELAELIASGKNIVLRKQPQEVTI